MESGERKTSQSDFLISGAFFVENGASFSQTMQAEK